MLHQTRGIVIHVIKYSDSGVIAKIYTDQFGLQSYFINGMRSKKAKIKRAHLQPLAFVEMVVSHKVGKGLQRAFELRSWYHFETVYNDIAKSSVLLFLREFLYKAIHEEAPNPALFDFLVHSLQFLDKQLRGYASFHLFFIIHFSRYMGFFPSSRYSVEEPYFNMIEGVFQDKKPAVYEISPPCSEFFDRIAQSSYEYQQAVEIPKDVRKVLLNKLIEYYGIHLNGFSGIKSHEVLEEVMS